MAAVAAEVSPPLNILGVCELQMKKLETFPLYLKVMSKKLRLDLMFDSDHIGLHERDRPEGPGPCGSRAGSGVGKAAKHRPPRLQVRRPRADDLCSVFTGMLIVYICPLYTQLYRF